MKEHDIVKPSETKTLFQSQDEDWPLSGQIPIGSEFEIAIDGNLQQKLFFDNLRGMLSVDEKLRKRTSRYKHSVLVGKVIEERKIIIKAKGSNTSFNVFHYLKLESCSRKIAGKINCEDSEFSMDRNLPSSTEKHIFEIEYVTSDP